jgi:hypothetical protein
MASGASWRRTVLGIVLGAGLLAAVEGALRSGSLRLRVELTTSIPSLVQIRWDRPEGFGIASFHTEADVQAALDCHLHPDTIGVRIDPLTAPGNVVVHSISLSWLVFSRTWDGASGFAGWRPGEDSESYSVEEDGLHLVVIGDNPYFSTGQLWQAIRRVEWSARIAAGLLGLLLAIVVARSSSRSQRHVTPAGEVTSDRPPSAKGLGRKLGLSALTVAVAGALLWRLVATPSGSEPDTYADDESYDLSLYNRQGWRVSESSGPLRLVLDPFTVYANYPGRQTAQFSIDANGFRGGLPDGDRPLAFLLGGSVAFGRGLASDAQLATTILNRSGSRFAFVDAGVVGFASGQELAHLVHHLDPFRPELYVLLDGWNEIAEQLDQRNDLGVNRSFRELSRRLHEYTVSTDDTGTAGIPATEGAIEPSEATTLARIEEVYLDNLARMHAWARAREASFLVLFQPDAGARRNPVGAERLAKHRFLEQYHTLVQHAVAFCRARGIACCDVSARPEFQDDPRELFLDVVHLTPAGNEVVAGIIADLIRDL